MTSRLKEATNQKSASGINISRRTRTGLSDEEAEESRKKHGKNTLSKAKKTGFLFKFIKNLNDPVTRTLCIALFINIVFTFGKGNWYESAGIAASVFLATMISTVSEHGSENAFNRISDENSKIFSRVLRKGRGVCTLPIAEIVVGDTVLIDAGEMIPADGIIISGAVSVDQSTMTGESNEINKVPEKNNDSLLPGSNVSLLRGCVVMSGSAEMEVKRVGDSTLIGEISREIQLDARESPLKVRLSVLAKQISKLGYIAAVFVAIASLLKAFVFDCAFDPNIIISKLSDLPFFLHTILNSLMLGLTVVVMAVPEGLPMMIAVVLSSNTKKMIRDNVLVKKPAGIEAAGSMNILFTDKTGTLTEGVLRVGAIYTSDGHSFQSAEKFRASGHSAYSSFSLCCRFGESEPSGDGLCAVGGNTTDRALLESVLTDDRIARDCRAVRRIPFSSDKKFSSVTVAMPNGSSKTFWRGAPEVILPSVKFSIDASGARCPIDKKAFSDRISPLRSSGKRIIILAEGDNAPDSLICATVLSDKLRHEAYNAVKSLRGAGIHVVMITGDNIETASSIAKSCGIVSNSRDSLTDICIDHAELSAMSDLHVKEILPRLAVVARALPSDKSRLVRIAQECDLVVGMTGDGVNDAPALKRADVGFAMGKGTQVAKDAGDIIILDNNLASIAKAVLYGRNIFKSIRKFIVLQLTVNCAAVGISMIGPFIGINAPVTVIQMLWLNITMDTLGGLAFAGESPHISYMQEPPKKRDEPILNKYMINQILYLGLFTTALSIFFLKSRFTAYLFARGDGNDVLMSAFFAMFIFMGVFNCFNARSDRVLLFSGLSKNKIFLMIMLTISIIQTAFVYIGGTVLRTVPLTRQELWISILFALSVFPVDLIRKIFLRLRGERNGY